ncbi:hypothetical protein DFJ74DRAFT_664259 [Hyaloraphidium curvatum]|nr:hypothetical protein DFJ74DRAFT_664259 [Hyaloraphidium curvatum]
MASEKPKLVLEAANEPSEVVRQGMRNYRGFGRPLTLDRYLAREAALNALPFGAGGHRWALKSPDGAWTSTCETYHRDCIWADGGVLKDGEVAVVASVFTPEHLRGRGCAAEMMRQLRKLLKARFPGLVASTLYSDIGPTFYAKQGWTTCPSKEAVLTLRPEDGPAGKLDGIPEARAVPEAEILSRYLPADAALLRDDVLREHNAKGTRVFAVVPTGDAVQWIWERSKFYVAEIGPPEARGTQMVLGFAIGTPDDAAWSYAILYPNFKEDNLLLQRVRLAAGKDSEAHATALLLASAGEARRLGLSKVTAWDTAPAMDAACRSLEGLGAVKIGEREREDSLSALCWYGPAAEPVVDAGDTVWLANEKYAWA